MKTLLKVNDPKSNSQMWGASVEDGLILLSYYSHHILHDDSAYSYYAVY